MKITTVIPVWGKLRWLAIPALLSLKSHWPGLADNRLTVITDDYLDLPLRNQLIYDSIAADFSGTFRAALEWLTTDIIFLICVDTFLTDKLSSAKIKKLVAYMQARPDVLRVNIKYELALERNHEFVEDWQGIRIIRCSDWRHCSLVDGAGLTMGLFRRKALIELLQPGWTLQEAEQQLIQIIHNSHWRGVGTDPALAHSIEIHNNDLGYFRLEQLNEADRELVKQYQPEDILWQSPLI